MNSKPLNKRTAMAVRLFSGLLFIASGLTYFILPDMQLAAPFLYIGLGFYLLYAAQLKPGGDGPCPALID